jgi:hypothetical protein
MTGKEMEISFQGKRNKVNSIHILEESLEVPTSILNEEELVLEERQELRKYNSELMYKLENAYKMLDALTLEVSNFKEKNEAL